ncbi:MAG: hypothetical protein JWN13_6411 [Betaproteobacteria bacterium]|nr:hypothetical protein [Betaproteobacteria bacterium]
MGDARRKGTFEEGRKAAIKRSKAELVRMLGPRDEKSTAMLQAGLGHPYSSHAFVKRACILWRTH